MTTAQAMLAGAVLAFAPRVRLDRHGYAKHAREITRRAPSMRWRTLGVREVADSPVVRRAGRSVFFCDACLEPPTRRGDNIKIPFH